MKKKIAIVAVIEPFDRGWFLSKYAEVQHEYRADGTYWFPGSRAQRKAFRAILDRYEIDHRTVAL